MTYVKKYKGIIPAITTQQMIEVDRLMIEGFQISLVQMMENAGRCLALLAKDRFLENKLKSKRIIVLAGTGGNGGGALVCARRLHNWGAKVIVYLSSPVKKLASIPLQQLNILEKIGIEIHEGRLLKRKLKADLIIDGIIGYSIKGNPRGIPKQMIEWANKQTNPILSLDTPSGLGLTVGKVHTPTIKATATLTLALPKKGLFKSAALKRVGELYLGDISVPAELYRGKKLRLKVSRTIFSQSDVIKLSGQVFKTNKKSKKKKK